jgi:hypothetical protein
MSRLADIGGEGRDDTIIRINQITSQVRATIADAGVACDLKGTAIVGNRALVAKLKQVQVPVAVR